MTKAGINFQRCMQHTKEDGNSTHPLEINDEEMTKCQGCQQMLSSVV